MGPGRESLPLEPASLWEMGLLAPRDWQGHWIGGTDNTNHSPAPMLRRTFSLNSRIKQARAYICGLGYYELHINGRKVGDHLLDPGYTRYDKRDLYVTYDVADALRRGKNAVGVDPRHRLVQRPYESRLGLSQGPLARRTQATHAIAGRLC